MKIEDVGGSGFDILLVDADRVEAMRPREVTHQRQPMAGALLHGNDAGLIVRKALRRAHSHAGISLESLAQNRAAGASGKVPRAVDVCEHAIRILVCNVAGPSGAFIGEHRGGAVREARAV